MKIHDVVNQCRSTIPAQCAAQQLNRRRQKFAAFPLAQNTEHTNIIISTYKPSGPLRTGTIYLGWACSS
jgi:hypothetical protein